MTKIMGIILPAGVGFVIGVFSAVAANLYLYGLTYINPFDPQNGASGAIVGGVIGGLGYGLAKTYKWFD